MYSIANMKVGVRLGLGYGIVVLLLVGVTFLGATRLRALNDNTQLIVNDRYAKTALFYGVIGEVKQTASSMRDIALLDDPEVIKHDLNAIDASQAKVKAILDKLEKIMNTEKGKQAFKALLDVRAKYAVEVAEFRKLLAEGKAEEAKNLLLAKVRPAERAYIDRLSALTAMGESLMGRASEDAADVYHGALELMLVLAGLAIVLAGGVGFWITRSITRPLKVAVGVAKKVASGDLTSTVEAKTKDETGELLQALKDMNGSLNGIVGTVC